MHDDGSSQDDLSSGLKVHHAQLWKPDCQETKEDKNAKVTSININLNSPGFISLRSPLNIQLLLD